MKALAEILMREDELGVIIRAHLYLERELNTFVKVRISKPTFSAKIKLALAIVWPEEFALPLVWLGRRRNDFGHSLQTTLTPRIPRTSTPRWFRNSVDPHPAHDRAPVMRAIQAHSREGSLYYANEWQAYATLRLRGDYVVIRKEKGRSVGHNHINGIEGF